ncbi:MAG: YtxH domain-containing protein [Bryobacteraceae bacterium]
MKTGYGKQALWIALATGTVSAGVALLFAPQSGAKTRRLIRRKAEDTRYAVREACERMKESGNDAARTLAYRLRLKLAPRKATERVTSG